MVELSVAVKVRMHDLALWQSYEQSQYVTVAKGEQM